MDLNRNGKFETNGLLPFFLDNGLLLNSNYFYFNGEPEWIGVLQYPNSPHSATNRYIGRYAYVVLPIGKMLDPNYIHNYSKSVLGGHGIPGMQPGAFDGFLRDQGVGSWELNLAGYLQGLNTNPWNTSPPFPANPYNYVLGPARNSGYAFNDAYSFLRFRYADYYASSYPSSLASFFASYTPNYLQDGIDEFGTQVFQNASYPGNNAAWPGGYSFQNFYNIQDMFDPAKTSPDFTNRLLFAGSRTDSYDRYTFQRLLATLGAGSAPELQTYVFDDPPRVLDTNLNIYPNPTRPGSEPKSTLTTTTPIKLPMA